ncbi:hypothetical protein [Paraburkholderia unamae]|uniref:Uncharacterized protein n=1 Tax=Paraburkholderia unamae TaxID=219649 RepID=A0ABX5KUN3_9BURK|nr:hypothetical protein [Paraburkholderia unamae]PVX84364.1 hypothetical protein C7402_105205 [Paraburkholderia unamae]
MPWHAHYYILNDAHEPVETTLSEWCHWRAANDPIKRTDIDINARVTTIWLGMTDDVTMQGPPKFGHMIEGPGLKENWAHSLTYEEALARHDRIAEWLRKRVARYGINR